MLWGQRRPKRPGRRWRYGPARRRSRVFLVPNPPALYPSPKDPPPPPSSPHLPVPLPSRVLSWHLPVGDRTSDSDWAHGVAEDLQKSLAALRAGIAEREGCAAAALDLQAEAAGLVREEAGRCAQAGYALVAQAMQAREHLGAIRALGARVQRVKSILRAVDVKL